MPTSPPPVLFDVDDGIATVTIARPERRNALSLQVANGLTATWQEIDARPEIRAVLFTSSDCGTFCAGLDLKEAARIREESGKDLLSLMDDPFQRRMREVRVPIVGALTGDLMGGGMMLAGYCDLRVGLAGTRVGITEVHLGRGSPWALPLVPLIPQPILSELILVGDPMPIERLAALGFINHVEATPDAVRTRARALAERIRDAAPLSVRAGKAMLRAATRLDGEAPQQKADRIYEDVYASKDAQEGPRAFAEKRKPRWQGS